MEWTKINSTDHESTVEGGRCYKIELSIPPFRYGKFHHVSLNGKSSDAIFISLDDAMKYADRWEAKVKSAGNNDVDLPEKHE